jgi:hypothetical protein
MKRYSLYYYSQEILNLERKPSESDSIEPIQESDMRSKESKDYCFSKNSGFFPENLEKSWSKIEKRIPQKVCVCLSDRNTAVFNQTVDKASSSGYISKAVKGDSKTRTTKVAARANPNALNLDNYIV